MQGSNRAMGAVQLARLLGSWRGQGAAYGALASRIRTLLLDGRLAEETRLPAERRLAATLGVSRTTVAAAYEQLRSEGFLHSRRGAGSWTAVPAIRLRPSVPWAPLLPDGADHQIDLTIAAVSAPAAAVTDAAAAAVDALPSYLAGHGYEPTGLPVLREAIAERCTRRGLATTPDQILVTGGAQHGVHLALRLLAGAGDRVLVESPTYPNTLDAIRAVGARGVPVGLAPSGWDLGLIETALRQAAPVVLHTIAEFQNPTGFRMPEDDRAALVAAARRGGAHVVCDESLSDLVIDAPPPNPAPLARFDTDGRVVSVGSVSKVLWGGLRVGWIRATPPLVRRLTVIRAAVDLGGPVLEQLLVAELLRRLEALLPARQALLAVRRDALVGALARELPAWRFQVPGGGLSLWVQLDRPVSTVLVQAAERHGVLLVAGPRFGADGTLERFLRLPFTLPEATLQEAVSRLAAADREVGPIGAEVAGPPGWVT